MPQRWRRTISLSALTRTAPSAAAGFVDGLRPVVRTDGLWTDSVYGPSGPWSHDGGGGHNVGAETSPFRPLQCHNVGDIFGPNKDRVRIRLVDGLRPAVRTDDIMAPVRGRTPSVVPGPAGGWGHNVIAEIFHSRL